MFLFVKSLHGSCRYSGNQRCSCIETSTLKSRVGGSTEIDERDRWFAVWIEYVKRITWYWHHWDFNILARYQSFFHARFPWYFQYIYNLQILDEPHYVGFFIISKKSTLSIRSYAVYPILIIEYFCK